MSRDKGADQIRTGVYDLSSDSAVRVPELRDLRLEFGVHQSPLDSVRLDVMPIKYVHARMPGRELIHLIPPEGLTIDKRFADEQFIVGWAQALCGRKSKGWIWGSGVGEKCRQCAAARRESLREER